jgi:molecular chaperone DnaK
MAAHNKTLGKFHLTDIPSAPRGVPQIEVSFDIDANGIVNVAAKDLGTGKEQKITLTASSGLDSAEVEQMVKDAESHADEDQQARRLADARNKSDQLVYQTEKTLKDNGDKLPDEIKAKANSAIEAAKAAMEQGDAAGIESSSEALEQVAHKIAEAIYKAPGGDGTPGDPGAAAGGASGAGNADEVIDAEVVDETK